MKKKILITGGAGYIGSHLVHFFLSKLKCKIIVIDNLSNGYKKFLPKNKNIEFYNFDLRNNKKIKDIFKKNFITDVFHLAALISVEEGEKKPKQSTYAIYNLKKKIKVSEKNELKPINIYAKTKLKCEKYIIKKFKDKKINYAILRYFNVIGCHDKLLCGHISKTHLFPNLAKSVRKNNKKRAF